MVGNVPLGSEHPIRVQTMTTTDTTDVKATVEQVFPSIFELPCYFMAVFHYRCYFSNYVVNSSHFSLFRG